jgi:hypothetical protein
LVLIARCRFVAEWRIRESWSLTVLAAATGWGFGLRVGERRKWSGAERSV